MYSRTCDLYLTLTLAGSSCCTCDLYLTLPLAGSSCSTCDLFPTLPLAGTVAVQYYLCLVSYTPTCWYSSSCSTCDLYLTLPLAGSSCSTSDLNLTPPLAVTVALVPVTCILHSHLLVPSSTACSPCSSWLSWGRCSTLNTVLQ